MYQISNELLQIAIKKIGAELCEISSVKTTRHLCGTQTLIFGEALLLTYFL